MPVPFAACDSAFSLVRSASTPMTSVKAALPIQPFASCEVPITSVTGAPDFDVAVTVTSSLTIDNTLSRVMIRSVADSTVETCCDGGRSTVTPSSPIRMPYECDSAHRRCRHVSL